jgi:hypothetical protein
MNESATTVSFLVRVYRYDSQDPNKLAGQVEKLDGSGELSVFTDSDELAAILSRGAAPQGSRRKRIKPKDEA